MDYFVGRLILIPEVHRVCTYQDLVSSIYTFQDKVEYPEPSNFQNGRIFGRDLRMHIDRLVTLSIG